MQPTAYLAALFWPLCSMLLPLTAHADVYGYVDEQGLAHFSTVKLNNRYQLFLRGGDRPFDTADLMTPGKLTHTPASPLLQALAQHPNLKKYETLLYQVAREFELEPALLKAIMAAESGFDPRAVSAKGAVGLMQVLPATAMRYGVQADRKRSVAQKLTDPKTNIRIGARYLRDLRQLFPLRQELVLASYNAGEGAVQKYDNKIPPYPETRKYVKLVTQFYELYKPLESGRVGPRSGRIRMTLPASQEPSDAGLPELADSASLPSSVSTSIPDPFAE